ncbi:unnamed protein product [Acanthoscelides obtectus]|uniref:CHK kinase-like domain-containing protein n=2 Tax=Acanthoscelides obtectus TaxID=200917 RepID=A0A9P0Q063_ACAOB|nr:unnamed protein product [Acanthoscelides obtectus]CAK1660967.1 hypothetical protein AOBTE_LOCUS22369 [Acanthoscelides obtectus]
MTSSISEAIVGKHCKLCEFTLSSLFIDKTKYHGFVDKLPKKLKLEKLGEAEFVEKIQNLLDSDLLEVSKKPYGKIYHVEVEGVKKPVVYDLLCEIFLHVDPESRAKSFHEIIDDYYNKVLSENGVTEDEFKLQVKLFLPYAKLERLYQCKADDIQEAVLELEECFLCPKILREDCYAALKNMYKSSEPRLIHLDVVQAQGLPGNLGTYFKLKLTVKNDGKTNIHQLFAKVIDTNALGIPGFSQIPFKKERVFFEKIMKQVVELGLEKLTDFCPKCYLVSNEMLLLDDLSVEGYESCDFHIPVSYKWLFAAVKVMAKFHAMSIIVEEKLSEKLGRKVKIDEEYPETVVETVFHKKGEYRETRDRFARSISEYTLSKFPDLFNTNNHEDLKEQINSACKKLYNMQTSDTIRNVLNHADIWGANIMYKEDLTSQAASVLFIDFQFIKYCSPAQDLLFLIYVNSDSPTRRKHMTHLIELYYKEMTQILNSQDIDAANIFTFDQFVKSCKEVEAAMICKCVLYGHYLLLPKKYKEEMMADKERASKFLRGDKGTELDNVWDYEPLRKRMGWFMEDLVRVCENEEINRAIQ